MSSRRAPATTPTPVFVAQGPAPVTFEEVLRRAIGDAAAWRALINEGNSEQAYRTLMAWKADLKAQRRIRAGRAMSGTEDTREHASWLARQAEFERFVDMRLRELPVFGRPPAVGTTGVLRRRVGEWRSSTATLVAGVLALEAGEVQPDGLIALLDAHDVDMGKLGRMTLREAAPFIVGVLDRDTNDEEN